MRELLKRLWQLRLIRYIPSNRSPILYLDEERLPKADLYIAPETYKRRQELLRERFAAMLAYAQNDTECRSTVVERYFGAGDQAAPCGVCDLCLARRRAERLRRREADTADERLSQALHERLTAGAADPRTLCAELGGDPARIAALVREGLDAGKIRSRDDGKLEIIP